MLHIRTHIALRALPVSAAADGVDAHGEQDWIHPTMPCDNTTPQRRHSGGITTQN